MPKKKLYLQVSFEQGMVDTIAGDYDYSDSDLKWQAPQSRSALYIENYDPNIIRGTVTKRYGYGLLRVPGKDMVLDVGLRDKANASPTAFNPGIPEYYDNTGQTVEVNLDRFTLLIDKDPDPTGLSGFGTSLADAGTVCGAMAVAHNKPVGQSVLIYFLRDIVDNTLYGGEIEERTRIVHFGVHTVDEGLPYWRNSHINADTQANTSGLTLGSLRGSVAPSDYPGWDIRGTFSGAARHGGTLVVTSNVGLEFYPWINAIGTNNFDWTADWIDEMFPCYVWSYWDYRRKRNKRLFWNIIADGSNSVTWLSDLNDNYTDDDKYSQFKVLYPSQKLTRDKDFVSWRTYVNTYTDPLLGDVSNVLVEGSVAANGDTGTLRAADDITSSFLDTAPVNSVIEVSIIETRAREYSTAAIDHVNDTDPADDRLDVVQEYQFLNNYTGVVSTIETLKNYEIAATTTDYWKIYYGRINGADIFDYISIVNGVLTYSNVQRNTKIVALPLLTPTKVQRDRKVGNGKQGDEFREIDEAVYWAVGISLPDYLGSNAPRPWLKGEKVPLLITCTIRGAEILLSKHVHTVAMDDYVPYPCMHYPSDIMDDAAFGNTNTNGPGGGTTSVTPYVIDRKSYEEATGEGPAAHKDSVAEQYFLLKDQDVRVNGRLVLIGNVRGFALAKPSTSTPPYGSIVKYRLYTTYKPYCIEPFNPTTNSPYVSKEGEHDFVTAEWQRARIFSRPVARYPDTSTPNLQGEKYRDANVAGHRSEHVNPKLLMVTVKLSKQRIAEVFESGIESLNLYCAEPSNVSAYNSVGLYSVQDPIPGVYMLPTMPSDTELNKYRLVKRYVLDGDGTPYNNFHTSDEIQYWKTNYTGAPTATNSWVEKGADDQTGFFVATGQHVDKGTGSSVASTILTPDFILWDYPVSTTLSLNSSGQYWQGRGAGLVTNIKGRTFLGRCIDQYGEEEQATIRYSDVQSGVITLDLFSEESFIKVGGLPHTAFAEYREQLWVYNESEVHRIQMPDIVNVSTWEYLDKIPGQGTFNQKTVITTPHGVVWCNESGVWLSDGRMPENIGEPVLTFYKTMATNAAPYYSTRVELPKFPFDEHSRNPYLEVAYDEFKNELVISSPTMYEIESINDAGNQPNQVPIEEYRLVFSFAAKTWHVQHADLPEFGTFLNEFDAEGKVQF